jgi:spermidine/putrescine ABC transporter ATP-binding subunit
MQSAEVRLDKIGKCYGDQWAVRGVTLRIRRGEFYTFLGPSGCGKTTLLRIIAGFVTPDEGTVFLDGEAVNHIPPWRRNVGMVFQNYALWPHMTVFENVAFGLKERRIAGSELQKRVRQALAQVDLEGTETRRPSQLSGGQQQRVALARTLVIQPRALLLDEPLSNLDAKLRAEMRLELLKLQRDLGLTTIYVTHDQEEALAMSTRVAVMSRGRVVQEGTPRVIYEQPVDEFVAAFVGKSNLILGKVANLPGQWLEVDCGGGIIVRAALPRSAAPAQAGDRVFLSVRPEAVEITAPGAAAGERNAISGRIAARAYQGSYVEYEITALGKPWKAHTANPKGKTLFQSGDEVALRFAPDDVVIVPAEGGET